MMSLQMGFKCRTRLQFSEHRATHFDIELAGKLRLRKTFNALKRCAAECGFDVERKLQRISKRRLYFPGKRFVIEL